MRLDIIDIINNVKDELSRTEDFLDDCENPDEELSLDIKLSIDRMSDIEDRIHYALILAVYAGYVNSKIDFEYDCDNGEWIKKFLDIASNTEFEYDEEGCVDSEWAYNSADEFISKLFEEMN